MPTPAMPWVPWAPLHPSKRAGFGVGCSFLYQTFTMHLALSWEDPHLREHPVVSAQRAEILIWLPTWLNPEHRSGVGSAPRPFPCQMQRFPRAKGEEGLSTSSSRISPSSPSASDPLIHEKKCLLGGRGQRN